MATHKETLYVHASFSREGKFNGWSVSTWKHSEEISSYGFHVFISKQEVEVEVPAADADLRGMAAEHVKALTTKMQAAHAARMAALTFLRNNLLALEGPPDDVAAPAATFSSKDFKAPGEEDDIPF